MSPELKNALSTLQLAAKIKNLKLRKAFLLDQFKHDPKIYKAIKEIAVNLVNKNVKLSSADKKKLRKYGKEIVHLATDKAKTRRKQHITQSGGYLPIVIPTIVSLLSSLING